MGSPTRDRAQCFGFIPSASFSGNTPGTPFICFTILQCSDTAASTSSKGSSICQRHVFPTGFVCRLQQNVHLFAHANDGVVSMHR